MVISIGGKGSWRASDKLGGEIFISSHALVYLCMYSLITNTMPTCVCAHRHSHLFLTLCGGNQITIETGSERERNCTQRVKG